MPGFEVIDEKEQKAISRIFDEGKVFFAHGFDKKRKHYHVREFEQKLKAVFSPTMADVLCVSSGTAAIKVALKALGIGRGDEVITQSFNFIATVEAIVDTGANVVFTDVDDTLNMCPKNLESLISKKTKAINCILKGFIPTDLTLVKLNLVALRAKPNGDFTTLFIVNKIINNQKKQIKKKFNPCIVFIPNSVERT